MARMHQVVKAQKDQGSCSVCGKPVLAGFPYKWVQLKTSPRSSRRLVAHDGCRFRPSQLTTSEIKGTLYDAQEEAQDRLAQWDGLDVNELKSIQEDAAAAIREAADMAREKADNIESGFGHSTMQSEELSERADAIEGWADEIENVDLEEFEVDGDEIKEMVMAGQAVEDELVARKNEWQEEKRSELEAALGNCPE